MLNCLPGLWLQTAFIGNLSIAGCCFQQLFLKPVFLDVNYFILATAITLWQCFLQMCHFRKAKPGNGSWRAIWRDHAKNTWLLCVLDARWTELLVWSFDKVRNLCKNKKLPFPWLQWCSSQYLYIMPKTCTLTYVCCRELRKCKCGFKKCRILWHWRASEASKAVRSSGFQLNMLIAVYISNLKQRS